MSKNDKQKNKGGRPPKFNSIEELEGKIDEYIEERLKNKEMPNKAGLCHFLDIDKSTYCEYKKDNHRFSHAIKRFEKITENAWVQRLGGNSPTGAIFYLKNAFKEDYKDRHETDITSGNKPLPLANVFVSNNNSDKENRLAEKAN